MVHRAFQASALESAIPISIPSNTEWKHNATISNMLSTSEDTDDIPVFEWPVSSFPFLLRPVEMLPEVQGFCCQVLMP
ncbi:hypothetical protein HanPI659440_Chr11g0413231 [Helianthus annuus]|nr:hypothetical protein HanPI659440_Chr11g0413231 [Helianthus annuus]